MNRYEYDQSRRKMQRDLNAGCATGVCVIKAYAIDFTEYQALRELDIFLNQNGFNTSSPVYLQVMNQCRQVRPDLFANP